MVIDFLVEAFERNRQKDALIWKETVFSYQWLLERVRHWQQVISSELPGPGAVVVLEADFSPNSVAVFLALAGRGSIIVPLTAALGPKKSTLVEIAQAEWSVSVDEGDQVEIRRLNRRADHPQYERLRRATHPGLVLFSSGSTGVSKGAVHDLLGLVEKFKVPRHSLRTITFLLYDHIGGLNTMLYTLSNAGCLVTMEDRGPDAVLAAIEKYRVELLPTSPTFINLVLLSEAYRRYDLSSLRTVTYGTEVMPEATLKRFHQLFPQVRLLQTYGLSELGILRSQSRSSDSLWIRVGGEGFETRVVEGVLQIRAKSAMLGYLNAPSPFTDDGWFDTGDAVEQDGDYLRILGRRSEIINVGGEKVYPAEVESVIQQMDNVGEVTVYGEKNAILGNVVCARVTLRAGEAAKDFISRLKTYCRERLARYKVPVKVEITGQPQYGERFKKMRNR